MQNKLHIIGIFLLVLFAGIGVQGGFVGEQVGRGVINVAEELL